MVYVCYAWPKEQVIEGECMCALSAGAVNRESYSPSTTIHDLEGGSSWMIRCTLPRLCYPPPPSTCPPPFHIPIPHPSDLTPHLLLLSEQSQPAIACAVLCLVSKIRQRIAAYKYPASPYLAAAFPRLHPSDMSVPASGTLWPPHGPHCRALGCDCETDICCSTDITGCSLMPTISLAAA